MPVLSRDLFTGGNDTDIEGRTPDGGGNPALQEGVWTRNTAVATASRLAIDRDLSVYDYLRNPATLNHVEGTNAASLTLLAATHLPDGLSVGDCLLVAAYSTDGSGRSPGIPPSGLDEIARIAGGATHGELVLYGGALESLPGDLTVSFSGGGSPGSTQLLGAWALHGTTADPVDVIGADSTWVPADSLGPISGITPSVPNTLTVLLGAKQNEWGDDGELGAESFVHLGEGPESALGTVDAGMAMLFRLDTAPLAIPDATVVDGGLVTRDGAGCGVMVSFKLADPPPDPVGRLRFRQFPSDGQSEVRYVCPSITGLGNDQAVQIRHVFWFGLGNMAVDTEHSSVLARYDTTTRTGYRLRLSDTGTNRHLDLFVDNAGATELATFDVPRTYSQEETVALCVSGVGTEADPVLLRGWFRGALVIEVLTFNPAQVIASGSPGVAMLDNGQAGLGITAQVNDWTASTTCDFCTGGPGNPFPTDPPPSGAVPIPLRVMVDGGWKEVNVPEIGEVDSQLAAQLDALHAKAIRLWQPHPVTGQWTALGAGPLDNPPPSDDPLPPYYDPCGLLTPPDIGEVEPIPFAGGRFFGLNSTPTSMIGDIFNGTLRALGWWSVQELTQVVARGGYLTGSQGGYNQFRDPVTRDYDPALMDAWIASHQPYMAPLLASPFFVGVQYADDFRSTHLWPPSGLVKAELERIAAVWAALYPGIRLGLRLHPTRFTGAFGPGPINGVSFYVAQYDGPTQLGLGPGNATNPPVVTAALFRAWRDAELSLAQSWGAQCILSINYQHGGNGSSGITVNDGTMLSGQFMIAPAELVLIAEGWFDDAGGGYDQEIIGMAGYEHSPELLAVPGMLDGMTTLRNGLMALPPLL